MMLPDVELQESRGVGGEVTALTTVVHVVVVFVVVEDLLLREIVEGLVTNIAEHWCDFDHGFGQTSDVRLPTKTELLFVFEAFMSSSMNGVKFENMSGNL